MKTKDKILWTSVTLFNRDGVATITTNHIAKELGISPGNLYFHYANKEEIVRAIYQLMVDEINDCWRTKNAQKLKHPLDLIEKNYEIFWKYRFFHREMYYLNRKDAVLSKIYKAHIKKILKLITVAYQRWIKAGWMIPIRNEEEKQFLVNILLATAASLLQFFESAEKQPEKKHIETGKKYVARLLNPYTYGSMRADFEKYIEGKAQQLN